MLPEPKSVKLVIHWPRFGPYHLARLQATYHYCQTQGMNLMGLETASQDSTYAWREEANKLSFPKKVIITNGIAEQVGRRQIWPQLNKILSQIQPDVVAVNGYSAADAQTLLLWCRLHQVPTILMFDSKQDDAVRSHLKETVKRLFVRQYTAAICAGTPHRAYLKNLGMNSNVIFDGYDVVDNMYFHSGAGQAQEAPEIFNQLPGLAVNSPYFLASSRFMARKNLMGLLHAYHGYCTKIRQKGKNPWRLIILGDGGERSLLENYIDSRNLKGVTLAGFRQIEDLPAYYGLARVFIHPALQDQWGLVVNEAMAAGLPVIVSRESGCVSDLVIPGKNGFVFDAKDTEVLSELMVYCTQNQKELDNMGKASRQLIQQWDLSRFAQNMHQAASAAIKANH